MNVKAYLELENHLQEIIGEQRLKEMVDDMSETVCKYTSGSSSTILRDLFEYTRQSILLKLI